MYRKFKYIELNDFQFNLMKQNISELIYSWDNSYLEDKLLGLLPIQNAFFDIYKSDLTTAEQEQKRIIDAINKEINAYNNKITKTDKNIIDKIKSLYDELYKISKIEKFYTMEEEIEKSIVFNKVFLITGIGGIGKSQYIFDFAKILKKNQYNHLIVYGKYCKSLDNRIFKEIAQIIMEEKFYFVIDAINEFDMAMREKVLNFINDNKNNENLRAIITYRDFSFPQNEYLALEKIATDIEQFSGVSNYDALEKISEKYNVDLSVYENLLKDKNPYHLSLATKVVYNNMLISEQKKPLIKGTHLYESMIKQALNRDRWQQTKNLVEAILKLKEKRLNINDLKVILGADYKDYIVEMKEKAFATTYLFQKNEYFVFLNESLVDYLIARTLFDSIKNLDEKKIIEVINNVIEDFYSVNEVLILMIFEKFNKDIKKALTIITSSKLNEFFNLEVFNRLDLSKANQLYISKILSPHHDIKEILFTAGGQHHNPFNCVNYLNKKLFMKPKLLLKLNYNKYEISEIKSKIKIWTRSIAKYDYSNSYLEEKFWFALWMSALPNGNIRFLARKMIYEITIINSIFIDTLINSYKKTNDDYIREGIIQILSTLKKKNKKIILFFKDINTYELININCMQYIHLYLYGKEKYIEESKKNILLSKPHNFNQKIFKFFSLVDFRFKYDYRMFGFEVYNLKKENIRFHDNFLKENKNVITKINKKVKKAFGCIKHECPAHGVLKDILKIVYSNIDKEVWQSKDVYMAWQEQFKKFMTKYEVKLDDLEKSKIFEDDEKNNIYKALDLSISNTIGSIASNYYMDDFCKYSDSDLGYSPYLNDEYKEKNSLYYPISVFNEDIDNLDQILIQKLTIPKKKTKTWADDYKLSIQNFKNLISPINYKNEEWRLIYGEIRKKENSPNGNDLVWADDYILNLAINEDYQLTHDSDLDRLYTIETPRLFDGLDNVYDYDISRTSNINNSGGFSDIFVQTDFNIPPTRIIKELNLKYNRFYSSWINKNNDSVILVNNNKGYWYDEGITGSVYIKEKYFQKIKNKEDIKYFGFCERFFGKNGHVNDSSLQIELFLDGTERHYKHYKSKRKARNNVEEICLKCPFYKKELKMQRRWKNETVNIINIIK